MDIVNFSKISEVLKYLKDNLSTTRASKIDNLDTSISSIAPTKFYTPSLAYISRINTGTGNWVTLKEVTGKGIVSEVLLYIETMNTNRYCGYRITVDGSIVMSGRFGGHYITERYQYYISGFSMRDYLVRSYNLVSNTSRISYFLFSLINQASYSEHYIQSIKNYPSIEDVNSSTPGVCFLYNPIKFSTNFKIEILDQTSDTVKLQCSLWLE